MSDTSSSFHFSSVTPSDDPADNFDARPRAIYIGGTGNLVVIDDDGTSVTFVGVPSGLLLPIRPRRVHATGTTATSLVAVF